jgi:hypothetical protein
MNWFGERSASTRLSENTAAVLLSMAAAALVVVPALLHGFPAGHDTGLHATAWFDIAQHWLDGVAIPSWGARFAYGLGEPTYLLYPPLSMWLGALLVTLFGPSLAPTLFLFITSFIGGFGTYKFCRLSVSQRAALFGALIYIFAPYLALNGYVRNAFAESLGAAAFPFAAYYLQRLMKGERGLVGLVASLTFIGLSDVPAAVVAGTALLLLAIVDSSQQRSLRSIGLFCGASLLSAAWAAFYILPAAAAKRLVQIEEAVDYSQTPKVAFALLSNEFRLIRSDFISALQVISLLDFALCLIPPFVILILIRRGRSASLFPLAVSAFCISMMMLPFSQVLYHHVPLLRYTAFSWRYLFVLSFIAAAFLAEGVQHRASRIFALVGGALLIAGWFAFWPPPQYKDPSATWNATFDQRTAENGPYFDHMPRTVPTKDFERLSALPTITVLIDRPDPAISIQVVEWKTELRRIRFTSPYPVPILLRLIYFPGWQAEIDGRPVPIEVNSQSGHVEVVVQGTGELVIRFRWSRLRVLSWLISLFSIVATLAYSRRRSTAGAAQILAK